jgi:hypothetical protein
MNAERNLFYEPIDAVDAPSPIAPCRTIPITAAIRAEDAAKLAARRVVITWKFTPSPKSHRPTKTPRKRARIRPPKIVRECLPAQERNKRHRESQARMKDRRRAAGQCLKCAGEELALDSTSHCTECLVKRRAGYKGYNPKYYAQQKARKARTGAKLEGRDG